MAAYLSCQRLCMRVWPSSYRFHITDALIIGIIRNTYIKFLSVFSCVWLWDPMDCTPPGSSVHGIFHARILEWVAISYSNILSLIAI